MTGVERQPPVDASWHRCGSKVVTEGHQGVALGPQAIGVRSTPGSARRVQGLRRSDARDANESEEVSAHAAHVRSSDSQHTRCSDSGIGRRSARSQAGDAGF